MKEKKKIVQMVADRFKFDEKIWGIVSSEETGEVVGTDGYLTVAIGDNEDVQKKPKFLGIMYEQLFQNIKSPDYKPRDDFEAGIAERLQDHTTPPEVDILMEEEFEGYYLTVYTDELMMYALSTVKGK